MELMPSLRENIAGRSTIQRQVRPFFESRDRPKAESTRFPVKLFAASPLVLRVALGQEFPSLVTTRTSLSREISLLAEKCITLSLGSTNL
jgi:hypothetical protein